MQGLKSPSGILKWKPFKIPVKHPNVWTSFPLKREVRAGHISKLLLLFKWPIEFGFPHNKG